MIIYLYKKNNCQEFNNKDTSLTDVSVRFDKSDCRAGSVVTTQLLFDLTTTIIGIKKSHLKNFYLGCVLQLKRSCLSFEAEDLIDDKMIKGVTQSKEEPWQVLNLNKGLPSGTDTYTLKMYMPQI